jgi:FKBP-type peptidyl-prolyl cis-trans isomerase
LHYVPNYPYFFRLENLAIDSAWTELQEGDSAVFKLSREDFNQKFRFYKPSLSDTGKVYLHFRLKEVLSKSEMQVSKQKALSKREIDEQAELQQYIAALNSKIDTVGDVFRILKKRNDTGVAIAYGSEVSIDYTGSFLNGYNFENTADKGLTPTFKYGKEYQLIEGMHLGLSGLKSGESVKIILPSRRAFGKEGSLAGIVPPYTAVIFDVNIIKVKTNQ